MKINGIRKMKIKPQKAGIPEQRRAEETRHSGRSHTGARRRRKDRAPRTAASPIREARAPKTAASPIPEARALRTAVSPTLEARTPDPIRSLAIREIRTRTRTDRTGIHMPARIPIRDRIIITARRRRTTGAITAAIASRKKKSYVKTTALVTAAALLFGVVSGGTMFGVNRAAELLFPQPEETAPVSLSTTQTVAPAQSTSAADSNGVIIEDVSPIVEAAMPSVVAITNTMLYQNNTWFGATQTYEVPSSGSGIIVGQNDTELLIVTNNHVIEDSTSLQVTFIDESTVDAAVKGTDSESDLAVIAVPLDSISADTKSQIKAATMGDSDSLKMGQGVIAIGNALGLGQSVTVGHVSALNREINVDGLTKTVIQTDAAINPGNSGGALLNAQGELIGINEAKYASTDVEGVGYAIPISLVKDTIENLMNKTTKVELPEEEQGYLGIQIQNINSATSQMYGMPEGVYVYKITENSAAANSDLREKDIITKFDGETVHSYADLTELLTYYKAGSTVTLTVQRLENGEYTEKEVEITLMNRPVDEQDPGSIQG